MFVLLMHCALKDYRKGSWGSYLKNFLTHLRKKDETCAKECIGTTWGYPDIQEQDNFHLFSVLRNRKTFSRCFLFFPFNLLMQFDTWVSSTLQKLTVYGKFIIWAQVWLSILVYLFHLSVLRKIWNLSVFVWSRDFCCL